MSSVEINSNHFIIFQPENVSPRLGEIEVQINILTKRLLLLPVTIQDGKMLNFCFYGDKETIKAYHRDLQIDTLEETENQAHESEENLKTNKLNEINFKAISRITKELIGTINLNLYENGRVNISYIVSRRNWQQRFGTEIVSAIVEGYLPALKERGYPVKALSATIDKANIASGKILNKLGFNSSVNEDGDFFFEKVI